RHELAEYLGRHLRALPGIRHEGVDPLLQHALQLAQRGARGGREVTLGEAEAVENRIRDHDSPKRRAALAFMTFGSTSGLNVSAFSASRIQRSGVRSGKSEPNSTRSVMSEFAYRTSDGGKDFGLQPARSI